MTNEELKKNKNKNNNYLYYEAYLKILVKKDFVEAEDNLKIIFQWNPWFQIRLVESKLKERVAKPFFCLQ